ENVSESSISHLALIFKRLRMYGREGRKATTLNLDLRAHKSLLDSQNGRCAICNYEFAADDLYYETELDLPDVSKLRASMPDEVSLERYFRRPHLDHIIPVFIGGDAKHNWQIL